MAQRPANRNRKRKPVAGPKKQTAPMAPKAARQPRKPPKRTRRGMSANLKVTIGVLAVVAAIVGYVLVVDRDVKAPPSVAASDPLLVRDDSHKLSTAADGKVTLVEFLDFECESCGAAYPGVEQLREEYAGRITYVVRYFPLPGHVNAMNAALAVEAAARQQKFEDMYRKMFETQKEWGEARESHAARFEGYAAEFGLDLAKYRADVADSAVADRIRRDQADGRELQVTGTPTFFLNGERFGGNPTYANLRAAVDRALAG